MPKFDANLTLMYTEHAFLDRFAAAAADGFKGIEYLGPYGYPKEQIAQRLADHELEQVLFNLPVGKWAAGERGLACLPDRKAEFRDGVAQAIDYAQALGCTQLNCLLGILPSSLSAENAEIAVAENLTFAAAQLDRHHIKLMFEPLNQRDVPGYFVSTLPHAERILDRVGSDNLYLHYDFYHQQVSEGDLMTNFLRFKDRIIHVQIADNPGRGEPGTGEINYRHILESLDQANFTGWIGCEYIPRSSTSGGLAWMQQLGLAT